MQVVCFTKGDSRCLQLPTNFWRGYGMQNSKNQRLRGLVEANVAEVPCAIASDAMLGQ